MNRSFRAWILLVAAPVLVGCESGNKSGPVDATRPAPVEPPADGFKPPPSAK